ncbi:hypothetical protein ACJA25_02730 [Mycoplasmopsis hyopharyngis]|uniref:hypothetical protein n=1 Tax=Mycoplasmopsis hyopharyngis TaxID=29558 RepID=UPI003873BDC2
MTEYNSSFDNNEEKAKSQIQENIDYKNDEYFNELFSDEDFSDIYDLDNKIEIKEEEKKIKFKRIRDKKGDSSIRKYEEKISVEDTKELLKRYQDKKEIIDNPNFLFPEEKDKNLLKTLSREQIVTTKIKRHLLEKVKSEIDYETVDVYRQKIKRNKKNIGLVLFFSFMFLIIFFGVIIAANFNTLLTKFSSALSTIDFIVIGITAGTTSFILLFTILLCVSLGKKNKKLKYWIDEHIAHSMSDNYIKWRDLKKYAFNSLVDLDFVNTSSTKVWVQKMVYPDVPHNHIVKCNEYSQNYVYRNINVNFQDAYLKNDPEAYSQMNLEKMKYDNREITKPIITEKVNLIKIIELDLKTPKFENYIIPDFNIFNFFEVSKQSAPEDLVDLKKYDTNFDITFKLKTNAIGDKKELLIDVLEKFMNDKFFAKDYSYISSSISCFKKKITAIFSYEGLEEDKKETKWQTLFIDNFKPFKPSDYSNIDEEYKYVYFNDDNETEKIRYCDLLTYIEQFSDFFATLHTKIEKSLLPLIKLVGHLLKNNR